MVTETSKTSLRYQNLAQHIIYNDNTTFDPSPVSYTTFTRSNTVTKGENYPNWRQRLANHQQCTTSLDGSKYTFGASMFECFVYPKRRVGPPQPSDVKVYQFSGAAPVNQEPSFAGGPSLVEADNLALTRYMRSIRGTRTRFSGGVFLGELHETLRLLKHPTESLNNLLGRYLSAARKRSKRFKRVPVKKRLLEVTKVVADTWLEYSFGMRPLYKDISDGVHALAEFGLRSQGADVVGRGKSNVSRHTNNGLQIDGPLGYRSDWNDEEYYAVKYYGWVGNSMDALSGWAQFGLTPENFVPTVWELVPYSFLSDYFLNIGNIIESASTSLVGLNWTGRTQVHGISREITLQRDPSYNPNSATFTYTFGGKAGKSSYLFEAISRNAYNGSLVPSLRLSLPISGRQYANMGALLISKALGMSPLHLHL